jgi:2-dehydropantoate 2-reductase
MPAALPDALQHLAGDGIIVSCQNGLAALDVAKAAGAARTVAASFFLPADMVGPGHVTYGSRARMTIGRVGSGPSPDLAGVTDVLQDFEPTVHDSDDILSVIWTKMAYGAMLSAVAMDDGLTANFLRSEKLRPILVTLMREVVRVARASGHPAEDADWFAPNVFLSDDPRDYQRCIDSVLDVLKTSTKQHSGPWQSIVLHKRRTEIIPQFAPMIELAEAHGIAVPVTRRLLGLIDDLENQRRSVGQDTMALLLAAALESGKQAPSPSASRSMTS